MPPSNPGPWIWHNSPLSFTSSHCWLWLSSWKPGTLEPHPLEGNVSLLQSQDGNQVRFDLTMKLRWMTYPIFVSKSMLCSVRTMAHITFEAAWKQRAGCLDAWSLSSNLGDSRYLLRFFPIYMWRPDNFGWGVLPQGLFIIFFLVFVCWQREGGIFH